MVLLVFADDVNEIEKIQHLLPTRPAAILPMKPADWINGVQFDHALQQRGYKCNSMPTRKKWSDKYGIAYEKRGNELWFRNEIEKIPSRKVERRDSNYL